MPASRYHPLAWLALAAIACGSAGCTLLPNASTATPASPRSPTPTAFQPVAASATPSALSLWISPSLPAELEAAASAVAAVDGRPIVLATDEAAAEIQLEPYPDSPLSSWVYAVAAPFPTVADSLTMHDLESVWTGQGGPVGEILVTQGTEDVMVPILGAASPASVRVLPERELSERAWRDRNAWAILPFGELDPSWKVLAIDGGNPIERDFEVAGYPLVVPFGASGPAPVPAGLAERLAWPASNRLASHLTVVLVTGVTAITRGVAWRMDSEGVTWPAEKIGDWLRSADITHVSQEIAFSADCPPPDPYQPTLRFCGDPEHFGLLKATGVDVVELTGNHILDWGAQAFLDTLGQYHGAGMQTFAGGADLEEARRPALLEHNGNRIAFLGCNAAGPDFALAREDRPGGMPCDLPYLDATLTGLRQDGYLPIFTFQWFEAYRNSPLPNQVEAFRHMIDAGAILVSGSQAHQPQGYESYNGGWIHYGLGNLFFDQMWSVATRQEMLDRYVFYEGRHLSTEILTAYLEDFAQPRPMTADERENFLRTIFAASGW